MAISLLSAAECTRLPQRLARRGGARHRAGPACCGPGPASRSRRHRGPGWWSTCPPTTAPGGPWNSWSRWARSSRVSPAGRLIRPGRSSPSPGSGNPGQVRAKTRCVTEFAFRAPSDARGDTMNDAVNTGCDLNLCYELADETLITLFRTSAAHSASPAGSVNTDGDDEPRFVRNIKDL